MPVDFVQEQVSGTGRPVPQGPVGQSQGRAPGSRNKATEAAELLLDGEAEALTRKAVELALEGDASALRLCLERIVPPRRERPVKLGLPAVRGAADLAGTMAAITTAARAGHDHARRGRGTGPGCRDLRPGGRDQRFRKAAAGAGRSLCRASVTRGWLAWRQKGRASIRPQASIVAR